MPDSKKVIEGLKKAAEELARYAPMKVNGRCQMYFDGAIYLLKEQEPKAVKIKKNAYNHEFYHCPRCDRWFEDFPRKPMFCDKCGQAVKWDADGA